ncbi:MAG: HAD family hydrolase [Deltaproteobacteria bacterium]|nr:HAD family hydrolase [Deltaproteobacteria bacterium]
MNTHQIKLVAFDFDGVIAETIKEWYFLGLKAFNHMGGDLPSSKEVGDSFRQARSFLKNAEDCYFVFKSIKERSVDFRTMTQERFNQLAQPFFEKEGRAIAKDIDTLRAELRKNDEENWLKLFSVFPEMISVLKKIMDKLEVVIATTRDRASVSAILEKQGIIINDPKIISREFSIDKREQMKFITKEFGVSFEEIFFIDDILGHLKLVASLGVNVVLASWGYSNRQQLSEAKEEGIPILKAPHDILSHLGVSGP